MVHFSGKIAPVVVLVVARFCSWSSTAMRFRVMIDAVTRGVVVVVVVLALDLFPMRPYIYCSYSAFQPYKISESFLPQRVDA